MLIKPILLSSIIAISAVIATLSIGLPRPDEPAVLSASAATQKIAPWVIDQTANGAQAEFFVVLNSQADLTLARQLNRKIDKGHFVYRALLDNALITQQPLIAYFDRQHIQHQSFYIVNAILVSGTRDLALKLADRSDVARIEGNPWVYNRLPQSIVNPSSPTSINSIEAGIAYIGAPPIWTLGYTGTGLVIGNQDTGFQWDHPALIDHYRGWNGASADHDYNWHDAIHVDEHGPGCGTDSPVPCDDYGHGTHTVGTAIGDDGAGNQIGVAPGAKWIGCRNMDNGWGKPSTYLECFQFFLAPYPVTGTYTQGQPALAPDVTVNSWSCPGAEGCSVDTLQAAVEAQRAAGIMTVAAATNEGSSCSSISNPIALYDASYTIGALNTGSDSIASFSSRGPVTSDGSGRIKPDISAPGNPVRSSTRDGGYGSMSGTSMATPHVAGAVALLWSARPELKNQITATEEVLNNSAVPILTSACSSSGLPNNLYGYGRLDIQAAVAITRPAMLPAADSQAAYISHSVTYTLRVFNIDQVSHSIVLSASAQWPTEITPAIIDNLGGNAYQDISVSVKVPMLIGNGQFDPASIVATYQDDVSKAVTTTLTTIGLSHQFWLMLILKN